MIKKQTESERAGEVIGGLIIAFCAVSIGMAWAGVCFAAGASAWLRVSGVI